MPDSHRTEPSTHMRIRGLLLRLIESGLFRNGILALIFLNAIILGLETSPSAMAVAGPVLNGLDTVILGIFIVELALRIAARGWGFFRSPWGIFDFIVIAIALVPASNEFAVLRAFRVLRVIRIVSTVPRLRRVVEALFHAIPGIGAIGVLLLIIFYVFAVIGTTLYGQHFPEWFGTIGRSMYSLFQIMTLESWSMGIVRPVMEVRPYAWAFFVPFIIMSSFAVLNLFIAIIVDSMQRLQASAPSSDGELPASRGDADAISGELAALRAEVRALREELKGRRPD